MDGRSEIVKRVANDTTDSGYTQSRRGEIDSILVDSGDCLFDLDGVVFAILRLPELRADISVISNFSAGRNN